MSELFSVSTGLGRSSSFTRQLDEVGAFVRSQLDWFATARQEREQAWMDCWALYLGTPQAMRDMRRRALQTVGDVEVDWRHNLNTGKGYETVETIVAYLMGAMFPNKDWFDANPKESGYWDTAKIVQRGTDEVLRKGDFINVTEAFLRQATITGQSVMALPWRYETSPWRKSVRITEPVYDEQGRDIDKEYKYKEATEERVIKNHPDFEVLDNFDIFLQPNALNPEDSPIIRRLIKTKAEVAQCIRDGVYSNLSLEEIRAAKPLSHFVDNGNDSTIKGYTGIAASWEPTRWKDEVEVWEYWGNINLETATHYDRVVTMVANKVVRYEHNPYWMGKPFVIATYTPIIRSIVGLGAIEPVQGLLNELNIITNQRLDCLSVAINPMWEKQIDNETRDEDLISYPGKVFKVTEVGTMRPIEMPNNFTITYQEASLLEQRIDKVTGTGNMISANAAREGERVTAEEIKATKEAGGNRLSRVHKHLENRFLIVVLAKVFRSLQQFMKEESLVQVPGKKGGEVDYAVFSPEMLVNEFELVPVGADHIADKDYEANNLLNFLSLAAQYQELSQGQYTINYGEALFLYGRLRGIDELDKIIQVQDPEAQQEQAAAMQPPGQQMMGGQEQIINGAQQMGGAPMATAVQSELAADGGANLMSKMFGVNAEGLPPSPELQMQQQGM